MKRKIYTLVAILVLISFSATTFAVKHQIETLSMSFSPATITANVGDTIVFTVGSIHTATQVSQATWEVNDNSPLSGGFNFSAGTHEYVLTDAGTIYYVCIPHAAMGMKGMITVQAPTGIKDLPLDPSETKVYPNPVAAHESIHIEIPTAGVASISLYSASGSLVSSFKTSESHVDLPVNAEHGIYFLRITTENKTSINKLVVK